MTQLGTSGQFASNDARFHAAAGATSGHDADDRVIYDTSNGDLWYDADGSGAGDAEYIGRLTNAPTLLATDIEVINGTAPAGGQTINGTANNDTLVGGAGNDTLTVFGPNADTLVGGTGDDTYVLVAGGATDSFIENLNEGSDTIRAAVTWRA